ncbi:MAG: acyltransferase family protein [Paludibacteraceae bacterium]|nr:acyltransferase family protein [Paludibacteraceae bacterium]
MIARQRELSWDFTKFILMFFIVFGHLCPAGRAWTPVTRVIGLFVIPGFFFVSGYFQSQVKDMSGLFRKLQRLFMRIVLPMLSWGTIYVFLSFMQCVFSGDIYSIDGCFQFAKYIPTYIMGIYWFFTALILSVVVGTIISWIIESRKIIGMSILLVSSILFCIVSPIYIEKYHFSFVWLFYAVGMFYSYITDRFSLINKNLNVFFCGLFIIIVVVGAAFEPQYTFYYKSNLLSESSILFVLGRFVLCLAATSSVIYGLMKFYLMHKDCEKVEQLASYGVDTLFIYCSHVLILVFLYRPFLLPYLYHEHDSWGVRVLEHVEGLIASVLMYYLMQKLCLFCKQSRYLRVFLMGIK